MILKLLPSVFFSPELEKSLKKRVKLHTHENGENGQSRENGQNEDNDSDDNYAEVGNARFQHRWQFGSEPNSWFFVVFPRAGHHVAAAGGGERL